MTKEPNMPQDFMEAPPRVSELRRIMRIFLGRKVTVVGLILIFMFVITAIFAPILAPWDPYKQDLEHVLAQPGQHHHILGTDGVGRDTLSRIIYGTRTSLVIGIGAIGIAALIGIVLGLVAGYFGGWRNTIMMRFVDATMSFPGILLALVIAAALGSGLKSIIIAIGISMMSIYARLMCGLVLSVSENDYVIAARASGASNLHIMLRHIFPNCLPSLIVMITLQMGFAILAEAGLSFLGIGIEPPGAAWGAMINDGCKHLLTNPMLSFAPGMAIMLVVFAFNMAGDGLRDALDPRLRGSF